MLNKENTVFVLVDVQGKLAKMVQDSEQMIANLKNLIQGLRILDVPIVWLEQYPEGLGPTNEELTVHLAGMEPISKITFSACKNPEFMEAIEKTGRKQILIAGIETHICVYQTATGLKDLGYEVEVVADAVSSRTTLNKEIGLEKMKSAGIRWTSVEMALYELMETAEGEQFKQVLKLLK
ncbi:nicotinamidase-like amidase [Schinkia azotoformans MEV2011]|uniref:Nicotinamidase-like amidase n=1 Tax=Schinkia azotoformans MEV2011 TaxID=1348973 RepID=A0A072NU39_SCHAZ|nr:hydrolase [Schinkia azotoformans]KEF36750.1 nicotinamidase-like amidase [Schinkia azotoformans MEV2011]MEC1698225.1 hydrolase [Schinkia azotoformans]MEC1718534.1 hydrolase [Schinkia azotoformans]MEC1727579.1 hydrolase [Schinkia azotoformans]MEC1743672.1 hydrolase [Schinkia azotoformans]